MSRLILTRKLYLGFLMVLLVYCTPSELADHPVVEQLDVFKVSNKHFSKFLEKYEQFISGLSETNRVQLHDFITKKEELWVSSRIAQVNCDCPGQSKCSASSYFSECCICWDPGTHDGACGCYWGVCQCKTEAKLKEAPGRSSVEETFIKFSALNFRETIQFLQDKKVNVSSLKQALTELEKYGLPLDN